MFMLADLTRRDFLERAAVGVAVGSSRQALSIPETEERPDWASAQPRLFSGCCVYSYGKRLDKGSMRTEDVILKAVELGIEGVDVTTYWLKSTEPSDLVALRHFALKNGVPLSGAAISTEMCQADPAKRAAEVDKIKKWIDATEMLGTSHLRVFGGKIPKGATVEQAIQWAAETMKSACDYAATKGITLGIEDHHGVTAKASDILEIIRRVDSPYAGINLDITNFYEDPYRQIELCIPYATHTHIRDFFSHPNKEPVDLDRVWQMFARAGYKGYMSAEYEGDEDPLTGVPKLIAKIKALCRKYSSV